jgi:hypothetical protein
MRLSQVSCPSSIPCDNLAVAASGSLPPRDAVQPCIQGRSDRNMPHVMTPVLSTHTLTAYNSEHGCADMIAVTCNVPHPTIAGTVTWKITINELTSTKTQPILCFFARARTRACSNDRGSHQRARSPYNSTANLLLPSTPPAPDPLHIQI